VSKTPEGKTLSHFLALPYTIEIAPDDGAWFVQIKELPGCMTEVDTWEEILPAIEEAKQLWLEVALERGRPIPEPVGVRP
jgi:antitoxin HicB